VHATVQANTNRYAPYLISVLFLLGLYFPSSIGGEQSSGLLAREMALLFALFGMLAITCGIGRFRLQIIGCSVLLVLTVGTLFSPFSTYAIGTIYIYVLLIFLYNLDLRAINLSSAPRIAFIAANVINLILGLGIILQVVVITQFLQDHYTYFYPELLPTMFALRKPVLTFATHSVAGFFIFLFFWMNLRTYEKDKHWLYPFFAISDTVFCLFLFSFTSLFFFVCELVLLIRLTFQRGRRFTLILGSCLIIATVLLVPGLGSIEPEWKYQLADYGESYLTSAANGPLGRYSSTGDLAGDLRYLRDNPLRPVGLSKPNSLFLMDSGPVEYLLRGSLPLLLLIYGGLYIFLKHNLVARRDARLLFIVILLFELGFPVLVHLRTLYLLPFFVIYMNGSRRSQEAPSFSEVCDRAALKTVWFQR
jgi:hypothetical protein